MDYSEIKFSPSSPDTIGMEIELQLLDANNLDLVDRISEILPFFSDTDNVKPEFIQNTVEVISPVCRSISELEFEMKRLVLDVYTQCKELGIALCGAGTHPFSTKLATITPTPRYLKMEAADGYPMHTQITFATHLHIGMSSGDEALKVMRGLKFYLPLLIGLSANSPFCHGFDTNYSSYRQFILAPTRSYGIPPAFNKWQEFEEFMEVTTREGIFKTVNDIHWDIRPRPHLGTLELRVMDSQVSVSDAIALAAFVKALVQYLRTAEELPEPELSLSLRQWIEKDNRFKAAHFGLQAEIYDPYQDKEITIAEFYYATCQKLQPEIKKIEVEHYISYLNNKVAAQGGAFFQRKIQQNTKSLKGLVEVLVNELEADIVVS